MSGKALLDIVLSQLHKDFFPWDDRKGSPRPRIAIRWHQNSRLATLFTEIDLTGCTAVILGVRLGGLVLLDKRLPLDFPQTYKALMDLLGLNAILLIDPDWLQEKYEDLFKVFLNGTTPIEACQEMNLQINCNLGA